MVSGRRNRRLALDDNHAARTGSNNIGDEICAVGIWESGIGRLSLGPIELQLSRGGGRTSSCTGLRLESPTDRYDNISLLVPLVDVPVGLSHLLQWIDTVNDRLQGPGFSKLLEQYQVFRRDPR